MWFCGTNLFDESPTLKLHYLIVNTLYSKCWKGSDGPTSCEVKSSLHGTPSKQVLQLLSSTFWTILNLTCSLFSFINCPSGHGFSGERLAKPRQLFVLMLFGFEAKNTLRLFKDKSFEGTHSIETCQGQSASFERTHSIETCQGQSVSYCRWTCWRSPCGSSRTLSRRSSLWRPPPTIEGFI